MLFPGPRGVVVAVAVIAVMLLGGCRSSFQCESIRKLRLGMTEADVRELLGPPASVRREAGEPIVFNLSWDYEHRPSLFWLHVRFYDRRMVLAHGGRKRFLDDDQTLFTVSAKEHYESDQLSALYCR